MMPGLNDLMAPDMQKILAFILPASFALATLVMSMSRGFSTVRSIFMVICGLIAIYFASDFIELF